MSEGKVRGPCALPIHRLVKNKADGPASIADDFNPSVNSRMCYLDHAAIAKIANRNSISEIGFVRL